MMNFPSGQYGVIYADPPWLYEMYSDKGHEKGAQAHCLLQNLFHGPYLELFSRTHRDGWTVWGNETEKFA